MIFIPPVILKFTKLNASIATTQSIISFDYLGQNVVSHFMFVKNRRQPPVEHSAPQPNISISTERNEPFEKSSTVIGRVQMGIIA
jgi:hypothetical protein